MTHASADSTQRPFAIVAFSCDADRALCRALVQELSTVAPAYLYRLDPDPVPPTAFALLLRQDPQGKAHLSWRGGRGDGVAPIRHNDVEFARHLVAASPGLLRALAGD